MIKALSNEEVFYHLRNQIPDTDTLISFTKQCAQVNERYLFFIIAYQLKKMNTDQWVSLIFKYLELFPDKSQIILKDIINAFIIPRENSLRSRDDLGYYQKAYSIMSGFGKEIAEASEIV